MRREDQGAKRWQGKGNGVIGACDGNGVGRDRSVVPPRAAKFERIRGEDLGVYPCARHADAIVGVGARCEIQHHEQRVTCAVGTHVGVDRLGVVVGIDPQKARRRKVLLVKGRICKIKPIERGDVALMCRVGVKVEQKPF